MGWQPTTSQLFQPFTLQTLALAATANHCMLFEYATGKLGTVVISQDEKEGKFYPSPVIDFITIEGTSITH